MKIEFRVRDYRAEEELAVSTLPPRTPAHHHPLAIPASSSSSSSSSSACSPSSSSTSTSTSTSSSSFKSMTTTASSSYQTSDIITRNHQENERSSTVVHLDELVDPEKTAKDDIRVITQHEYVSRLCELKEEICQAWRADNRIGSLKLSIKVARLLVDTSIMKFYPTLFILVVDLLDVFGDLVWERIKRKAEYDDDGTVICSLVEDFVSVDVCSDAKETCYNWFCKIGSIHELLPRIYLELAILHCWRFLEYNPSFCVRRLTMMMRGLADPLASAYCHLYMACRAHLFLPYDIGYLLTSISDINILLRRIIIGEDENKRLLIILLEPAIEWIMKCIFMAKLQKTGDVLLEFGIGGDISKSVVNTPWLSIVLHYLLKELPAESVNDNALEIIDHIEQNNDISFDQLLNYRLLGLKLCECQSTINSVDSVLNKVFQVITKDDGLKNYLIIAEAYLDIILQYRMDSHLSLALDGILKRAENKSLMENELDILQSIILKLVDHMNGLKDVFALKHFLKLIDLLYGGPRKIVNIHILNKMRSTHRCDPSTIQFLFEISQSLHNNADLSVMKDDYRITAGLICRFVWMADFGAEIDRHLTFLVKCRAAFGRIDELKETIVHSSNFLASKAIRHVNKFHGFIKACVAFSEVTIPSISAIISRLNLYLETAEVALSCGLLSHTDGLIDSAICCLQSIDLTIGYRVPIESEYTLSSILKLCSILVMIPGNCERIVFIPRTMVSIINSKLCVTPILRVKMLCAILSLSATLSQNKLPYCINNTEVMGNDHVFFGETFCSEELASISKFVLQDIVDAVEKEPYSVDNCIYFAVIRTAVIFRFTNGNFF